MLLICSHDECDSIYFLLFFFYQLCVWNLYEYVKIRELCRCESSKHKKSFKMYHEQTRSQFHEHHIASNSFSPALASSSERIKIKANVSIIYHVLSKWSMDTNCLLNEIETTLIACNIYFNIQRYPKRNRIPIKALNRGFLMAKEN